MDLDDKYRKNAEEAQRWADRASNDDDKVKWLNLAKGWLSLIRRQPPTDQERFEEAEHTFGTKQERSEGSH